MYQLCVRMCDRFGSVRVAATLHAAAAAAPRAQTFTTLSPCLYNSAARRHAVFTTSRSRGQHQPGAKNLCPRAFGARCPTGPQPALQLGWGIFCRLPRRLPRRLPFLINRRRLGSGGVGHAATGGGQRHARPRRQRVCDGDGGGFELGCRCALAGLRVGKAPAGGRAGSGSFGARAVCACGRSFVLPKPRRAPRRSVSQNYCALTEGSRAVAAWPRSGGQRLRIADGICGRARQHGACAGPMWCMRRPGLPAVPSRANLAGGRGTGSRVRRAPPETRSQRKAVCKHAKT
eukprot:366384-Chlamydomonas_euryale.AAC.9